MSKIKVNVWGRDFDLPVLYECREGQELLQHQKDAAKLFLESDALNDPTQVMKYVVTNNSEDVAGRTDNIFRFVIPRQIYVMRKEETNCVALICNYKFDPEHGLAIIYENGNITHIGAEDILG